MRRVLFILLLLLPGLVWAGNKKKDDKKKIPRHFLPGRWIEVKRTTLDSAIVPFSDTLFMTFQPKDTFTYRVRNGFVYRGKYTIDEEGHLDFGTVAYDIARSIPNRLIILTNAKGIYYYEVDTSTLPPEVVLEKEDKAIPVTDIDVMIGHWTVYKRVADKEGAASDFDAQIKSAYITGPSNDNNQGVLYCGNDPDDNPSWVIKKLGTDQSLECSGKNQRFIKVVKCQKGEMVLEEAGISYYLKQFK